MALGLALVADGGAVGILLRVIVGGILSTLAAAGQQPQHLVGGQLMIGLKEHIEGALGGSLTVPLHGNGLGQLFVQVVDALPVTEVLAVAEVFGAVGLLDVDLGDLVIGHLALLRGHQEAVLQRQGDQVGGGHHVLGVGDVDLVHHHHVGVDGHLVVGHLHGHILVAGQGLKVPHLVGIADGEGVALAGAVGIDDGGQLLHAVPSGVCRHQDHGGEGDLADAGIHQGIGGFGIGVIGSGHGGADGDALFVHAHLAVGLTHQVAVLIHHRLALLDGVPQHGIAIGMGGIGHREAVCIFIHLSLGVIGRRAHLKHFVVQLADVFRAAHIGRAVF